MGDQDEIVFTNDFATRDLDFDINTALNESRWIKTIYFAADEANRNNVGIVFETEEGDIYPMVLSTEVLQHMRRQLDKLLAQRDNDMLEGMWQED